MTKETGPQKAVLYMRVARNDGDRFARAIAAQRHACQRRAAELELDVVGEYVDRGSGLSLDERPRLTELLAELEDLNVGYVITYGHAQISRDLKIYVSIMWTIQKAGARLEIAGLPHQKPGAFTLLLIARVGELQLAELQALDDQRDEPGASETR